MGFGFDRTENVLWRIDHGQLDGISPRAVVVLIGTNNLSVNSVEETHAGVSAVVEAVLSKLDATQILLLGVLPRGERPGDRMRKKASALNHLLAGTRLDRVTYFDAGEGLVEPGGRIKRTTMPDFLHPTESAYRTIAANLEPTLSRLLSR
jgi:lysophospholipase L1-like esterase